MTGIVRERDQKRFNIIFSLSFCALGMLHT